MQLTSGEAAVHKGLIKQLNNLKTGWGDTVQIEVVCHGPGIDFLTIDKTKFKDEIYLLKAKGVDFVVCENSLREREVPKEAILPEMTYVKMGIGEIVMKQEAGWIYISKQDFSEKSSSINSLYFFRFDPNFVGAKLALSTLY